MKNVTTLTEGAGAVTESLTGLGAALRHWPEFLMEAAGLGAFLASACSFGVLLEHPVSPLNQALESAGVRRALMGAAMGFTAVGIITSPWGRRSGAHLNPAVTLTYWMLGKIAGWDAMGYVAGQFSGGLAGVLGAYALIGPPLEHSSVNFVATLPGSYGLGAAFLTEMVMGTLLMFTALTVSNSRRWKAFTPYCVGLLVAVFIYLCAPISGMSLNAARTFASAVPSGAWTAYWIYLTAPALGMLCAAVLYRLLRGANQVFCAKFDHRGGARCIFRCRYRELAE